MTWQLRINDTCASGLAFDLRDVLRALGRDALGWQWVVSGVGDLGPPGGVGLTAAGRRHERLDATGPGAEQLEALERSGASISGAELLAIAEQTQQVIWGEFRAFPEDRREMLLLTIIAFDSSWFDVFGEDKAVLARVARSFSNTTLTSLSR